MDEKLLSMIEEKFDSLTGAYERYATENFVRALIAENRPFSMLLVDGDNFKNVNDGYGHKVGDLVIKRIADKLRDAFGDKCILGRFGGDEFYVIMPDVVEYKEVWQSCHNAFVEFQKFSVPGYPSIFITITIGLSRFSTDGNKFEELFEKADKALYRGKQKGRSCFIIYLDEKHKNIKIHSSDSPTANTVQMHNTLFSLFEKSDKIYESIPYVLQFFTTTLMIDHVGIQGKKNLVFSEIYSLSKGKKFWYIDNALIALDMNKTSSIFYCNDISKLLTVHQDTLAKAFEEQLIISTFFAEISYGDTFYGYLRADTTASYRIWQNSDMDLMLTAAKILGMALHYQGKTLEDFEPVS
ncbi:MAG: GGDEF domain-containing protein [Treponema sp.]|nr:GGDEF domain-containing protein [Treponema sp.]